MMDPIPGLSVLVDDIRHGKRDPVELLDRCLESIARQEGSICAWVEVDEEGARSQARAIREREPAQRDGRLLGVPVGVKDIFDVEGRPTRAAAPWRVEPAERDAPVVKRLRDEGAIVLGKTVTTQLACFDPSPTRNPWNPDHTPGGSSSGSAAGVAAGMCLAALGSQTGGSITRPAAYCGVSGLKPTWGALDTTGVVPVSYHLDHVGFLARTAADLAVLWTALTGDGREPLEHDAAAGRPEALVVPEPFFRQRCAEGGWAVFDEACERFVEQGVAVNRWTLPFSFDDVLVHHRRIMAVEAAAAHAGPWAEHESEFQPLLGQLMREGRAETAFDYADSLLRQRDWKRQFAHWLGDDVLLTPATPSPAPATRTTTGEPSFNSPFSFLGVPTVTISAGAVDGLPFGIQLVGRPCSERQLLDVAAFCEAQLPGKPVLPVHDTD